MADYMAGLSRGCDSGTISPNSEPFVSNRPRLLTVQFSPSADRVVAVGVTLAQSV